MDDERARGAVSDQSEDGVQVGGPLRGGSGAWLGRAIASAAGSWPGDARRAAAGRARIASSASAVGPEEAASDPPRAGAGPHVAGREHDRRSVTARRAECPASARAVHRAADAAAGG